MRFTVTALGSTGDRDGRAVVASISQYLLGPRRREPPRPEPGAPTRDRSVTRYYADSGDEPGRWHGRGADELGLAGRVGRDEFAAVLAGRDPHTGARLITARGAAGRVPTLGSGTAARHGPDGEALYSPTDTAAILGISRADVEAALDRGEHEAVRHLFAALTERTAGASDGKAEAIPGRGIARGGERELRRDAVPPSRHEDGKAQLTPAGTVDRDRSRPVPLVPDDERLASPDGARPADTDQRPNRGPSDTAPGDALSGENPSPSPHDEITLVPYVDSDGLRYVVETEIVRAARHVGCRPTAAQVLADGHGDDELSVPAAARLIGAGRSYVSRLCRNYLAHKDAIDAAVASGDDPHRAYMLCRRDEDGRYRIARAELVAFVERRRRPAVRVGYDVTATTEKSFSVLALLGGPDTRRAVLDAVEAANDTGLDWLERHAAGARAGGNPVAVTGWAVASFRHLSSRRLDPFVHHHNVVANTVSDEHGERRALDARRLYRSVSAASALATAQVRYELTARLGVAWRPARRGGWEIAGIDDAILDEFSQRTREIRETVQELEDVLGRTTDMDELQAVVSATRPSKRQADGTDEKTLLSQWWRRARMHGLTPERLHRCLGRAAPTDLTADLRDKVLAALHRAVTVERSVFGRTDVLAALVDLRMPGGTGPLVVPASELERLADVFLSSHEVVRLAHGSGHGDVLHRKDGTTIAVGGERDPQYTTAEMLRVQARILRLYRTLQRTDHALVPDEVLDKTLHRFPDLSDEQRSLVRAFCRSGHGAQSAIGRPGTGKTHALRAATAAWRTAGYRVLGTAVKAEAARQVGRECAVPAEPLAWYLNRLDDPLRTPFDGHTVLLVDEASTVGDRHLDRLLAAAEATGASLRFVGDPAQHGSITAGGMWRVLTERFPRSTPELTVGRRVCHDADVAAAEALRAGDAVSALEALDTAGHLHVAPDERMLYVDMLTRWWAGRHGGQPHPMVDRRNDQRLVLNRLARRLRLQMGELGAEEVEATGGRRFAVGDDVVARMGSRRLYPEGRPGNYVRNGAHGTVTAVHRARNPDNDGIAVAFDDLGEIELPRSFFDEHTDPWGRTDVGIDHAYAVTSYAVEGMSYAESSSHVDPRSSRPEVYVDITRGEDANHIFVTSAEDPLDGERLPAVPAKPERVQLEDRLAHSRPEPTAIELV